MQCLLPSSMGDHDHEGGFKKTKYRLFERCSKAEKFFVFLGAWERESASLKPHSIESRKRGVAAKHRSDSPALSDISLTPVR